MATCKRCGDNIIWAFGGSWVPLDVEAKSILVWDDSIGDSGGYRYSVRAVNFFHKCRRRRPGPPRQRSGAEATLFCLPDAPPEVLRAAFKALARLHHPDVGGSEESMKRINAAMEELRTRGRF